MDISPARKRMLGDVKTGNASPLTSLIALSFLQARALYCPEPFDRASAQKQIDKLIEQRGLNWLVSLQEFVKTTKIENKLITGLFTTQAVAPYNINIRIINSLLLPGALEQNSIASLDEVMKRLPRVEDQLKRLVHIEGHSTRAGAYQEMLGRLDEAIAAHLRLTDEEVNLVEAIAQKKALKQMIKSPDLTAAKAFSRMLLSEERQLNQGLKSAMASEFAQIWGNKLVSQQRDNILENSDFRSIYDRWKSRAADRMINEAAVAKLNSNDNNELSCRDGLARRASQDPDHSQRESANILLTRLLESVNVTWLSDLSRDANEAGLDSRWIDAVVSKAASLEDVASATDQIATSLREIRGLLEEIQPENVVEDLVTAIWYYRIAQNATESAGISNSLVEQAASALTEAIGRHLKVTGEEVEALAALDSRKIDDKMFPHLARALTRELLLLGMNSTTTMVEGREKFSARWTSLDIHQQGLIRRDRNFATTFDRVHKGQEGESESDSESDDEDIED